MRATPFRVLITLLITHLLSPLGLRVLGGSWVVIVGLYVP